MTAAPQTTFGYRDIKPEIGATILADKAALLSGVHANELRELLELKGVLVFPQLHFSDDKQIAFTKTLGKFTPEIRGDDIYKVTLDKSVTATAG